ncbi:MAG TPA: L-aspartate oxidase [Candidatus Binatia bacterium]|nr:L-aspartate oxidase [Candidatus Binatia bacterium]
MTCDFDFLVIGSGIAGLTFALEASRHGTVGVVTKTRLPEGSSDWAQGGVASVWSPEDSFASHAADTERAGAGLCHPDVVRLVVEEGPERVREMIALGTRFSLRPDADGEYDVDLGLEGGHSQRRILHALDATGHEMMRALVEAARARPGIRILEHTLAIDLLVSAKFGISGAPRCWGAYALDRDSGRIDALRARATILATGGAGKVYLYTSNPDVATGDGIAVAYRAGVPIGNMEFIQFHPTCLYHPQAKSFLISETVRGEGGILKRPDGTPFMKRYDERAELAPRDIVARAIDAEMKLHGFDSVLLDISHRPRDFLEQRFPTILARCRQYGIDPAREPIPVVPAAHYTCGGVVTDGDGRTALAGLWAAGEVAMTGLHGANRLASNSLLEGLVFGHRAARSASDLLAHDRTDCPDIPAWNPGQARSSEESVLVSHTWDEIRRFMWSYVGIVRSDRRLARARARIDLVLDEIRHDYWDFLPTADSLEVRNLAAVADLIIASAAHRRESRGLHFNVDCPTADDARWKRDTVMVRDPRTQRPVALERG